jgi:predicted ATPase/DNA-binding XRE family transcriptional regulator
VHAGDPPEDARSRSHRTGVSSSFGAQLRVFRERAGLSQEALAERAGLSVATLAALEHDQRLHPHPHTLATLADALSLTLVERTVLLESAQARQSAASGPPWPAPSRGAHRQHAHAAPSTPRRRRAGTGAHGGRTHNLPSGLSSLVGRQQELAEVQRVLASARLVTLIGAGGVGKTRLALGVAAATAQAHPDGVWLVALAPLVDAALVPHAVAAALGVRERAAQPLLTILTEALREQCALLVLDNCEHLINACAQLAETLLSNCPELTILATSREPLSVSGEVTWRVPSLRVPTPPPPPPEQLSQFEAVRLFIERATAARPDFQVTNANAPAVSQVCWRLDGIPLAIELAAAWVRTLSIEQLAARLDDRFRLLVGGSRTAPPRQQTLRGTIDWSYGLLSDAERRLFTSLSVFAGGWTLEAAEAICELEGIGAQDVLALLRQLVDKSLVVVDDFPHGVRYRLLETMRAYGREQAEAAGDLPSLERRHLEWYLAMAESVPYDQPDFDHIQRLAQEQHNFRAALRRAIEMGETQLALRLGAAVYPELWYTRGQFAEGRAWLTELLALPGAAAPTAARAHALAFAGHVAGLVGRVSEAEALLEEGITVAQRAGSQGAEALCWQVLGNFARYRAALLEAEARYRRAIALARSSGSRGWEAWSRYLSALVRYEFGDAAGTRVALDELAALGAGSVDPRVQGRVLSLMGWLAQLDGDTSSALALEDQSRAVLQALGDQQGLTSGSLIAARSALVREDRAVAAKQLGQALTLAQDSGEQHALVRALEGIAQLVAGAEPRQAASLVAAATQLRDLYEFERTDLEKTRLDDVLDAARLALGETNFATASTDGQRLTHERTVALGLELAEAAAMQAVSC